MKLIKNPCQKTMAKMKIFETKILTILDREPYLKSVVILRHIGYHREFIWNLESIEKLGFDETSVETFLELSNANILLILIVLPFQ